MFSWLISPSKAFAEGAEIGFAVGLFFTTLAVVVGLIGEYRKGGWWERNIHLAEMLVILGVAGEMLTETGAFWYSLRLQAIEAAQIVSAQGSANEAARQAGLLGVTVNNLHSFVDEKEKIVKDQMDALKKFAADEKAQNDAVSADLKANKEQLEKARIDALSAAESSKKILADMKTALNAERELDEKLLNAMKLRELNETQIGKIAEELKPYAGQKYTATLPTTSPDAGPLWTGIDKALTAAGWVRVMPAGASAGVPPAGIGVDMSPGITVAIEPNASPKAEKAAVALTISLNKEGVPGTDAARVRTQFSSRPDVITLIIGQKPPQ